MKILITTDCYKPTINGVVTSIINLESELRRLGHDVKILCPSENIHCVDNDNVYRIGSVGMNKIYNGARMALRISHGNLQKLIEWKPDIIHSQSEFTSFIMAKKISNKKPLSGNLVSHAENKTRTKQNPNLQTYKINGVKVRLTAREARTLKKAA